jgi:hypothetical protein
MEKHVEAFKALLADLASKNQGEKAEGYNQFFGEMFKDAQVMEGLLFFAIEAIARIGVSNIKSSAVRIAKFIQAALPTTNRFFPEKKLMKVHDRKKWQESMRLLNLEYVVMTKLATFLLAKSGDLTLSRNMLENVDETQFTSRYLPGTDSLQFGTKGQAGKWHRLEDRLARDSKAAEEQQRKFDAEKLEAEAQDEEWEKYTNEPAVVMGEMAESSPRELFDAAEKLGGSHVKVMGAPTEPNEESDPTRLDLID